LYSEYRQIGLEDSKYVVISWPLYI